MYEFCSAQIIKFESNLNGSIRQFQINSTLPKKRHLINFYRLFNLFFVFFILKVIAFLSMPRNRLNKYNLHHFYQCLF